MAEYAGMGGVVYEHPTWREEHERRLLDAVVAVAGLEPSVVKHNLLEQLSEMIDKHNNPLRILQKADSDG